MRLAIMQPYVFPYLPYFQLIHAVDCFVILDTVQFIRGGWMNRNWIMLEGKPHRFVVPVHNAPLQTRICDIRLANNVGRKARKLNALYRQAYQRSACWKQFDRLVTPLIAGLQPNASFLDFAQEGLEVVARALELKTAFVRASKLAPRQADQAEEYVIEICRQLHATRYINSAGGKQLYRRAAFEVEDIELGFLEPHASAFPQRAASLVDNLSILDLLANVDLPDMLPRLERYSVDLAS